MADDGYLATRGAEVRLFKDEGRWVAEVPAWSVCMAEGATPEEALTNLDELAAVWEATTLASGAEVPDPGPPKDSGNIALRVDGDLHGWLKREAERLGLSLNAHIAALLNQHRGGEAAATRFEKILTALWQDLQPLADEATLRALVENLGRMPASLLPEEEADR
ncbi:type II toxin-antitoxin system HicB family antitoxin [bacterium]|nr:type II toxin-antitoxin system HicB family antitoxin [bacterium]